MSYYKLIAAICNWSQQWADPSYCGCSQLISWSQPLMCCWQLRLVSTNKLIPGIDVFVHASLYTFVFVEYLPWAKKARGRPWAQMATERLQPKPLQVGVYIHVAFYIIILTLLMAGSRRVQTWRGGLNQPPPPNFAPNQFPCPKIGMPMPKGISNHGKFVS